MATTITYKGSSLASFSNNTKTLKTAGKYLEGDITVSASTILGTTTVIPSETTQNITPGSGYEGLSQVTVAAITNTYVGSGVTTNPSITVSGPTVTVPSGYYDSQQTNTIAYAIKKPTVSFSSSPGDISVDNTGLVSVEAKVSSTSTITTHSTSGYVDINGDNGKFSYRVGVSGKTYQLPTLTAQTITPTESTQTLSSTGKYMTGDVTVQPIPSEYVIPTGTLTITAAGTTDVSSYASVDVPEVETEAHYNFSYRTQNNQRLCNIEAWSSIESPGFVENGSFVAMDDSFNAVAANTVITPSESTQTIGGITYIMEGPVTINPITSTYVGSGVTTQSSLTVNANTITANAGYYANAVTATIANAVTVPPISLGPITPIITVSNSGLVSTDNYSSGGNRTVVSSNGYITTDNSVRVGFSVSKATYQLPTLPAQSFTPSSATQTVASTGKYMLGDITVDPIPSEYIIPAGTITITANTTTVNVAQYANAEVDVPNTHTITITGGDPSAYSTYIQLNPDVSYNNYHNPGTIKFHEGDHLRVYCSGTRSTSGISVNGVSVAYSSFNPVDYEFDLPNCDIVIDLQPGSSSRVYITIPELEIVSNGQYIMSGYGLANVTIPISAPEGTITITTNGTHTVSQYAYADVNVAAPSPVLQDKNFIPSETSTTITADAGKDGLNSVTVAGITNTYVGSGVTRLSATDIEKEYRSDTDVIRINIPQGYHGQIASSFPPNLILPTQSATTIIPSESQQTAVDIHKWTTGTVTVAAITSTYVGSGVTTNPSITVSGQTVTVPSGYYNDQQTKTITNAEFYSLQIDGPNFVPVTGTGLTITVDNTGKITAIVDGNGYGQNVKTAGYVSTSTTIPVVLYMQKELQLPTQGATTVTPSTATQTVNVTGKYMTGNVTVNPIPSQYIVPSGTYTISSVDSTNTFNVTNYASAKVTITDADSIAY